MKTFMQLFSLSLVVLFLPIVGCKKSPSSAKFNDKDNQLLSQYVTGYSSGMISSTSHIKVKFVQAMDVEVGATAEKSLLKFSPKIDGELIWEDKYTLAFVPNNPLPHKKNYKATLNLSKLVGGLPKSLLTMPFSFSTPALNANLVLGPPQKNIKTGKYLVSGRLTSSGHLDQEKVEQNLTVNGQKDYELTWKHSDGKSHQFVIDNIVAKSKEFDIEVKFDGRDLGLERLAQKVTVPEMNVFKVLRVVHSEHNNTAGFKVYFSDEVKKDQSFKGLVAVDEYSGGFRFLPEGSVLTVVPTDKITGSTTVRIHTAIESTKGKTVAKRYAQQVDFAKLEPQLRLVGNGVIVPKSSSGVFFPFDAIALKYVDVEIFKIFNNNVLQFMQINEPDGTNQMQRVGQIVYQKKVALESLNPDAQTSIWTRYALDLSSILDMDPAAIYQVRMAFRPGYGDIECPDLDSEADINYLPVSQQGNVKSIMGDYYGFYGYFDGYNWDNRSNPCAKEYYYRDRFIQRNVMVSNMGIMAKQGADNELFLAVSDLLSSKPVGQVDVEFFDYQQQSILSGKTASDGVFHSVLPRKPYFVLAKNGDERGYLRLDDGQSLSVSRFDVDGQVVQKGTKGFIYGDRGVWRPGDSIYLNFILVKEEEMDDRYPVTLKLYDARNNLYTEKTVSENIKGMYSLAVATRADAPTGYWRAKVQAGGASFSKNLKIETVKPNRLKIIPENLPEEIQSNYTNQSIKLQVNWLHGAPGGGLDVQVKRQYKKAKTTFTNYHDYSFNNPLGDRSFEQEEIFKGKTDANGVVTFADKVPDNKLFAGKMKVAYQIRATEKGGDFSTRNATVMYSPYAAYVGLMIPKKNGYQQMDYNKPNEIKLVSLNENGKPLAGRKIEVAMYRMSWRWWWDSDDDYVSRYNRALTQEPIEKATLITNSKGQIKWEVTPPRWGRYLILAGDKQSKHAVGDFAYAGYPWRESNDRSSLQAAAMLPIELEKKSYQVGDEVKLKIPAGKQGRALVTIEKGTTIVQSFWRESNEGSNVFSFTATEDMVPNIYCSVSLFQPHENTGNDLPMRLYGIAPVKIEDASKILEPKLVTDKKWEPDTEVTIEVSEAKGREMAYTIAIVDDGLLDLTNFKTPSPYDAFHAKEALRVKTWDVYDYILGAFSGDNKRILAIGGDDEAVIDAEKANSANRFKPVIKHIGPFLLKKGKTAKHTVHMPNYVGSVRAMLVTSGNGAYGHTEVTVPVKKALMVQPTLPRVLGSGEQTVLPVTVFATETNIKNVTVTVNEKSGLVTFPEAKTKKVIFTKTGEQIVYFPVHINNREGVAQFEIKSSAGAYRANDAIEIAVRNSNPMMNDIQDVTIEAGKSFSQSVAPYGIAGSNKTTIEVSNLPPINLGKRLDYLIRYPHGCIEQTTSSVFPQLFVDAVLDLSEAKKKEVAVNIQAGIDRLKLFQLGNGGFSYWPGSQDVSPWGTNYAGHFLLEAKAKGYDVPQSMVDNFVRYQSRMAKEWHSSDSDYGFKAIDQAYRLHLLALADKPDLGAMNRLRTDKKLTNMGYWELAAAYALAGKKKVGQELISKAESSIKDYVELGRSYGSSLRDMAMALESARLVGDKSKSLTLLRDINDQLGTQRWYSTHSTAYGLLAISRYYEDVKSESLVFSYKAGAQRGIHEADKPMASIELDHPDQATDVTITNKSDGTLFVRVIRQGKPATGKEPVIEDQDLKMAVVYKSLDGRVINPERLTRGTDFYAEVSFTNPGTRFKHYENLAFTQIFPAGWEIQNSRMTEVEAFSNNSRFDYQDFRDDRVFTYFNLGHSDTNTYRILLNAAYQGKYYLPSMYAEAMYDNTIRASTKGKWVEVL